MWITEDDETLLHCCSCKNLLRDPMLLQCLHNVCRMCLDKVCCTTNGSTSLVCPACNYETGMGIEKENLFVAGQVGEFEKLKSVRRCGICIQRGKTNENVDAWCSKCQMSMCEQCSSDHYLHLRDHWPTSLSEVRSMNDLLGTSAHKCRHHGGTYDLLCWACKIPACVACAKECFQNEHDVGVLESERTRDHFDRIKENICRIQTSLDSKRETLQTWKNVVSELDAAQANDMKELQANKRAAAESLERAYKAAEAALKEHYSKLHEKALEFKHHIELMDVRAGHASKYSQHLTALHDKTGLLDQQVALLSGLQSLMEELDKIRAPQDAKRFVTILGAVPEDMDSHMSAFIGMPRLLTDDLCCSDEVITWLEMDLKIRFELGDSIAQEVPYLAPASSSFETPVKCWDVAVSADGCRLLLAAAEHGLKEFDLTGAELSSWRPAKKKRAKKGKDEQVWTVEALLDGRVAVGLCYSQTVVLLRRGPAGGDAWLVDKRVTELQISPWLLSVHADLVAVSECRLNEEEKKWSGREEKGWEPDRGLVLASLRCGRVLSRQQREYEIESVTVTAQALVTASWGCVKLSDGREEWVVDACSHEGQLMWRRKLRDVSDICAAPSGRVLYMSVWEEEEASVRVSAVRGEDGEEIGDMVTSGHGLWGPAGLSLNVRVQGTVAAVLSYDFKEVTVFSAKGGQ